MGDRACRIDVSCCNNCPFLDDSGYWEGEQPLTCSHPKVGQENNVVSDPVDCPRWCPLRGSVTMVAGPAGAAWSENQEVVNPKGNLMVNVGDGPIVIVTERFEVKYAHDTQPPEEPSHE